MGTVYAAYDPELERRIAIKILHPMLVSDDTRARFLREAQALARLSHPNVVTVHDVGTVDDSVFLAMEYVPGRTLAEWLKETPRSPAEIVAVVEQAGRGIAAAHAAGIVHRDIKPDNVLIADDGRVVVMDFGLARNDLRAGPDRPDEASDLDRGEDAANLAPAGAGAGGSAPVYPDEPLTLEGGLMGTIGFMSPEQALAESTDARSDQWSFCATLYFALYGRPPIDERRIDEYVSKVATAVVEPPARRGLGQAVRRALRRGLSRDPEDRFASVDALLAALRPTPGRRISVLVAAVALALVAVVTWISASRVRRGEASLCPDPAPAMREVWSASRHDEIREAFESSGAVASRGAAGRVVAVLDQYAEHWVQSERQACEATRVQHVASEETMHFRLACLERRRTELGSLVRILSRANAQVVGQSVEAAYGLASPSSCDEADARQLVEALPEDASQRSMVVEARLAIADAASLLAAGMVREGMARAEAAVTIARAARHRATEAEALMVLGEAREFAGLYDSAPEAYSHALAAAEAAAHDAIVAQAAARLAFITGDKLLRTDEAGRWLEIAYAALDRLGPNDGVRAKILLAQAPLPTAAGHPEESLPLFDQLVPLSRRLSGEESPQTARALNNLGYAQQMLGRHALALETHERALGILERTTGPDTAFFTIVTCNQGSSLIGLGRYDEARDALEHAVTLASRGDPQSFWVGWASQYLGLVALRTGEAARALEATSRGLEIAEKRGDPAARLLVGLYTVRGDALLAGGDATGALGACQHAAQVLEQRGGPSAERVLEWDPYACIGEALLGKGSTDAALVALERSVSLPRRVYPGDLALARFALARALLAAKRELPRARELAHEAGQDLAALDARSRDRTEVARWLADLDRTTELPSRAEARESRGTGSR
jgi:tRNA A-37 threonylcarbamoyl transferase component Bud32/tetratricopeptide (TPR) repeat protein